MNLEETPNKVCVHKDKCGGCLYQGTNYQEQLRIKEAKVLANFKDKEINIEEYLGIKGSPEIFRYRNKMEYTFGDEVKDGEMTLGLHMKKRYFSVINTDQCLIVDEDFNRIQRAVLEFSKDKSYKFYHKKSHKGFLRHLVVRKGVRTKELLINLVTTTQNQLDIDAFIEMLLKLPLDNEIIGILHTENDKLADAVIAEKVNILWGRDYYREKILDLDFKVGAFSFFQTNVEAAEKLYIDALAIAQNIGEKIVFDLYSGTGTITQALAKKAKKVIGIEIVPEAVAMARASAEKNGLTNCEFIEGDVLKVLKGLGAKPDLIVLDPPRAGVHPKAMNKIFNYGVNEIIYMSCNPVTLAENLAKAGDYGYFLKTLKLYDNFPFTRHLEAICKLERLQETS